MITYALTTFYFLFAPFFPSILPHLSYLYIESLSWKTINVSPLLDGLPTSQPRLQQTLKARQTDTASLAKGKAVQGLKGCWIFFPPTRLKL